MISIPTVSVGIPTCNRAKTLKKAIRSVLDQSFRDFELSVLDNSSTDDTPEVVKSFDDARIRYVRNEENLGMMLNFNQCLKSFRGRYCAFLGSDDYWLPGFLESMVEVLDKNPSVGIAFTNHYFLRNDKLEPRKRLVRPGTHKECAAMVLTVNPICLAAALIKKDVFNEIGEFRPHVFNGDFDLYLRVARAGYGMYYVDQLLSVYRLHEENESKDWLKTGESMVTILSDIRFPSSKNERLRRKKLSLFYRRLGMAISQRHSQDALIKARSEFKKSLQTWPVSISAWAGYLTTYLPKAIHPLIISIGKLKG